MATMQVMPVKRGQVGTDKSPKDFKACIVGRVNHLRAYSRIIAAMERAHKCRYCRHDLLRLD